MLNLNQCIFDFFEKVKSDNIEIYNEFSLQHDCLSVKQNHGG